MVLLLAISIKSGVFGAFFHCDSLSLQSIFISDYYCLYFFGILKNWSKSTSTLSKSLHPKKIKRKDKKKKYINIIIYIN